MIKESITIDDAVVYLNSILEADPLAVRSLLCLRVPCNVTLADHPSAQVDAAWNEGFTVGLLGVINGLFGVNEFEWGVIACILDAEKNKVKSFIRNSVQ